MELRPHDLLKIDDPETLLWESPCPPRVEAALANTPFVVVRRHRAATGMVAVGIRGQARSERFAALLPIAAIRQRITPEQLALTRPWASSPRLAECAALQALDAVADVLEHMALTWGPVGSVGFELASSQQTITASSDLDLLIRAPQSVDVGLARAILHQLSALPVRPDIQLETSLGAVALQEFAQAPARVLLRTADGPQLVTDPWGASQSQGSNGAEP